jgi:DNA ligase-1
MKRFAQLFNHLDQTNKTNKKVGLLKAYFSSAPDDDKVWALALFTGRRPPRSFKSRQVQEWAMQQAGIPEWLFYECYGSVGDQAETISLILPPSSSSLDKSLHAWFKEITAMKDKSDEEKRIFITTAWSQMSRYEVFVFNKLLMGSFRIGVSQTLVIRAIAEVTGIEPAVAAHRVMGQWTPGSTSYHDLFHSDNEFDHSSKPYPFYLAYAIEGELHELGQPGEWFAEWKWDGIRSQIISRNNKVFIWSRGEELVTDKFPELLDWANKLPDGTVLDGEIVCFANGKPLPFNVLQTRIGRKNLSKKILTEAPVAFIAYDLLEMDSKDLRVESQQQRREKLQELKAGIPDENFRLSPLVTFSDWNELKHQHAHARENAAEGFMLKRKAASYQVGRKKGDWWKWKVDPLTIDAVLIYAQKGSGRRAELYTDYTFAVWDNGKLVPFAKAYSGLTDDEIRKVDAFVKRNTLEKFGPVRTVKPELVFEIGFEGINRSTRHKSGIAVRFPRMLRWRTDKPAGEADTLDNLRALLDLYG